MKTLKEVAGHIAGSAEIERVRTPDQDRVFDLVVDMFRIANQILTCPRGVDGDRSDFWLLREFPQYSENGGNLNIDRLIAERMLFANRYIITNFAERTELLPTHWSIALASEGNERVSIITACPNIFARRVTFRTQTVSLDTRFANPLVHNDFASNWGLDSDSDPWLNGFRSLEDGVSNCVSERHISTQPQQISVTPTQGLHSVARAMFLNQYGRPNNPLDGYLLNSIGCEDASTWSPLTF